MPASKQDKVLITCPHCGHTQSEPRTVISTVCKKCRQHIELEAPLKTARKTAPGLRQTTTPAREQRRITCFECGAELEVPLSAESTMCKRCSRYLDLKDYVINSAVSKNFKTKGTFVIEPKGYVFNTEAIVGEAVIKGRFLGRLTAERSLTIYSTAEIKGSFQAGQLVIPAGNFFRWASPLQVGSAEIAGELTNDLQARGLVVVRATARLFGDVKAMQLVVESGAVVVGRLCIGQPARA